MKKEKKNEKKEKTYINFKIEGLLRNDSPFVQSIKLMAEISRPENFLEFAFIYCSQSEPSVRNGKRHLLANFLPNSISTKQHFRVEKSGYFLVFL